MITISGKLIEAGQTEANGETTQGIVLLTKDDLHVFVSGLTRDECKAMSKHFDENIEIIIKAKVPA